MSDGFGARLRELRRRVGLTQQALARGAELSVSAVARLEQGGNPAPDTVAALCRALGVPVEAFDRTAEGETDHEPLVRADRDGSGVELRAGTAEALTRAGDGDMMRPSPATW